MGLYVFLQALSMPVVHCLLVVELSAVGEDQKDVFLELIKVLVLLAIDLCLHTLQVHWFLDHVVVVLHFLPVHRLFKWPCALMLLQFVEDEIALVF